MTRVRTLVATEILLVFGLLVFVGVAYFVDQLGFDQPVTLSAPVALVVAAIPAMLWLAYFHAQDRHEPEPKHYVAGAYLLGAFVAGPVAAFLADLTAAPAPLIAPPIPTYSGPRVVEALLILGLCQELAKYAVVRYSVYLSDEFDEPMDGLIYATAVGIGFATYQNFMELQGSDHTVYIATGAANAVVTTLAHACFAGVTGYFLGRARFATSSRLRRVVTLGIGLLVAATLNGNFQLLEDRVVQTGVAVEPWRAVALAAGFAGVVFAAISLLMKQLLAMSPHRRS